MVDRRIQKTKKALTEALIHLVLEKSYEKVTIQEIIDRANVGRSTFYSHYESKEQLLLDGHSNLNVEMFSICLENELNFQKLFMHISQNQQLAKAMLGKKSGHMMTEFFKNTISLELRKFFGSHFNRNKTDQQLLYYISDAAAIAVISLLVSWLEDDFPFSVDFMSAKCKTMVSAIFS